MSAESLCYIIPMIVNVLLVTDLPVMCALINIIVVFMKTETERDPECGV